MLYFIVLLSITVALYLITLAVLVLAIRRLLQILQLIIDQPDIPFLLAADGTAI